MRPSTLPLLAITFIILFTGMGCSSNQQNDPLPTSQRFAQLYPEDLSLIDRIDIRSGSSGELRTVTDPRAIRQWVHTVRDIVMEPDPNQDGYVGYLYAVKLYAGDRETFNFTPGQINEIYYLNNPALSDSIRTLFMEHSFRPDDR
jgi:hypothetical protein